MELGCRVRWFTASTMTLQHQLYSTIPSIFKKSTSTCTDISIRVHPYPHPQHIKGAERLYIYIIWKWDGEWGGLQPQPWSYSILVLNWCTLNFPRIHLHLNRYQCQGSPCWKNLLGLLPIPKFVTCFTLVLTGSHWLSWWFAGILIVKSSEGRVKTEWRSILVGGIRSGCSRYQNLSLFHVSVDQAPAAGSVLWSNCSLLCLDVSVHHSQKLWIKNLGKSPLTGS